MMTHMQPVFKPLLKPHLEDLEKKVAPGLFILTWASMNIDGYLHRFKQVRHMTGGAAVSLASKRAQL
jgi:dynein heavy chain